jgi:hypothetical protein
VPRIALGFDQLDPSYGRGLVVRDQSGQASEFLCPCAFHGPPHYDFGRRRPGSA